MATGERACCVRSPARMERPLRELIPEVLGAIAPEADLSKLDPSADLRVELEIDSMDLLRFAIGLREQAEIEIPESNHPRISTLNGCIA
jgi:acyl carrier protein